jgi:hypothetical protein
MSWFGKSKQERWEDEGQEIVDALREGREPPPSKGLSKQAEKVLERDPNYYYCGMCGWCSLSSPCEHLPRKRG